MAGVHGKQKHDGNENQNVTSELKQELPVVALLKAANVELKMSRRH